MLRAHSDTSKTPLCAASKVGQYGQDFSKADQAKDSRRCGGAVCLKRHIKIVLNTVFLRDKGVVSTDGRRLIYSIKSCCQIQDGCCPQLRKRQKVDLRWQKGYRRKAIKRASRWTATFQSGNKLFPKKERQTRSTKDIDGARRSGAVLDGINSSLSRGAISVLRQRQRGLSARHGSILSYLRCNNGIGRVWRQASDGTNPRRAISIATKGDNGAFA
jgi:hypothetical protein